MPDKTWKASERAIAKILGGVRNRPLGSGVSDVIHRWLAPEVKTRKKFPKWLHNAMEQAEANAKKGLLPIVVLHQVGLFHKHDLVMLRLEDFVEWFGRDDEPSD